MSNDKSKPNLSFDQVDKIIDDQLSRIEAAKDKTDEEIPDEGSQPDVSLFPEDESELSFGQWIKRLFKRKKKKK
jgi:hypothetical protein